MNSPTANARAYKEEAAYTLPRNVKRFAWISHICGQIANGSKHYETRHKDNDPAVRVSEKWEYRDSKDNELSASYILEIRDDERMCPALEVFSEAVAAWEKLFQAWYFEDQFITGDV